MGKHTNHVHKYVETYMLLDGCKVFKCETCPDLGPLHLKVYGCTNSDAV